MAAAKVQKNPEAQAVELELLHQMEEQKAEQALEKKKWVQYPAICMCRHRRAVTHTTDPAC